MELALKALSRSWFLESGLVAFVYSLFEAMTSLTLLFFLFFSFQGRWMDGSLKLFQDIVSFLMFLCPLRLVRSESIVVCFHSGRLPF